MVGPRRDIVSARGGTVCPGLVLLKDLSGFIYENTHSLNIAYEIYQNAYLGHNGYV